MKQQLQRKAINQFPYGEAHMHIFMNGTDYKKAVADQKMVSAIGDPRASCGIPEARNHLAAGRRGYLRNIKTDDGTGLMPMGSPTGHRSLPFTKGALRSNRGKRLRNHAGVQEIDRGSAPAGRTLRENYDLRHHGLYSWRPDGYSLADSEIRELIHIAHEEGFPVMAHTNGSQAVRAAALAGVDSIEHGNFCDEDALQALAASDAVWHLR